MEPSDRGQGQETSPAGVPHGATLSGPGIGQGLALVGKATPLGMSAGCLTAFMTIGALFLGMWLDRLLDTRPMFTLGFVLGSIPLSLILMIYQVRRGARSIAESESDSRRAE